MRKDEGTIPHPDLKERVDKVPREKTGLPSPRIVSSEAGGRGRACVQGSCQIDVCKEESIQRPGHHVLDD